MSGDRVTIYYPEEIGPMIYKPQCVEDAEALDSEGLRWARLILSGRTDEVPDDIDMQVSIIRHADEIITDESFNRKARVRNLLQWADKPGVVAEIATFLSLKFDEPRRS